MQYTSLIVQICDIPFTGLLTTPAGHSLQHQVSCQPTVCLVRHHIDPATSQAIQQGPPERPGRVLWRNLDLGRKGAKGQH